MANKRLQKKRETSKASASVQKITQKKEPLKVTTNKVEPLKVETKKSNPIMVETKKSDPVRVETKKIEPIMVEMKKSDPIPEISVRDDSEIYKTRLSHYLDELKWLYCELYQDDPYVTTHLNDLLHILRKFYDMRSNVLKEKDFSREHQPDWYQQNTLIGMEIVPSSFASSLSGITSKLDYIQECGINYIHLTSLLDSPESSGADDYYSVTDYRKVCRTLGNMDDFNHLTEECHKRGINVSITLSMNHTSSEHDWAKRAYNGEKEYQNRYFFYDNYDIPSLYDQTCEEKFPLTAPGNFTWIEDIHKHVMTTFTSAQWDLNYRNPVVLNEMIFNILYLANQGTDIICLENMTHIWKQIGTNCVNLPQIHTILRIIRMVSEIVCPGTLILGDASDSQEHMISYFGTDQKPECHLLCHTSGMADIWHTVATKDITLLRHQLDKTAEYPKHCTFINVLRNERPVYWNLDYRYLSNFAVQELPHRNFLNSFLSGIYPDSFARGGIYISDPSSSNVGLCGTTASLCGIERFGFENDQEQINRAIQYNISLHALLLSLSGIPVIHSGDEIAQVNDYSYKNNPQKVSDSRNLHRNTFNWQLTENRRNPETVQGKLFPVLTKLEQIRSDHNVFHSAVSVRTIDTWDNSILAFIRENEEEKFIGLYNFSDSDKVAWIDEDDGIYYDLLNNCTKEAKGVQIPAFGFFWLSTKK